MKFVRIDKGVWDAGLRQLTAKYRMFGPVKEKDWHVFKELEASETPDMGYVNTRLSPKSIIYPQSESLFKYSLDPGASDAHILQPVARDQTPRAVIGIRPCDAKAFVLVRRNFDTPEYQDPYWLDAYLATTFVGLACEAPCSTCFCTSAGSGPYHTEGLDVLLIDAEDAYLARVLSEKGAALMSAAGWDTAVDSDAAEAEIENRRQEAESRIRSRVQTDRLKKQDPLALFEAPFWKDASFACINCGTCTYSCPTCWCFDIQDEASGRTGVRQRHWDSCMYPLFTLHGSGHNPRDHKLQRVRQRFMHKLKYYVDRYDSGIQCVGCGRCIQLCPVNIDIRRVCHTMNSYDPEACACPA